MTPIDASVQKIESLIAAKRAPFELRQKHVQALDVEILNLSSKVDDYLGDPTAERLKKARTAEIDLVALKSLRERLGELNIDAALVPVLDQALEGAPFFVELAEANTALLKQCAERLREFRIEAVSLREPSPLLDLQIRVYGHEIAEAEKQNTAVKAWIRAWGKGQYDPQYWNFWSIYRTLKGLKIRLYAASSEMPVPEGYCYPSPIFDLSARVSSAAGRVLIPGHQPEEALEVVSGKSSSGY